MELFEPFSTTIYATAKTASGIPYQVGLEITKHADDRLIRFTGIGDHNQGFRRSVRYTRNNTVKFSLTDLNALFYYLTNTVAAPGQRMELAEKLSKVIRVLLEKF